jgi:hypothetical protein
MKVSESEHPKMTRRRVIQLIKNKVWQCWEPKAVDDFIRKAALRNLKNNLKELTRLDKPPIKIRSGKIGRFVVDYALMMANFHYGSVETDNFLIQMNCYEDWMFSEAVNKTRKKVLPKASNLHLLLPEEQKKLLAQVRKEWRKIGNSRIFSEYRKKWYYMKFYFATKNQARRAKRIAEKYRFIAKVVPVPAWHSRSTLYRNCTVRVPYQK